MSKKLLLILATLAFVIAPLAAQAEELGVTVDYTWASKYLFRGFDVYGGKAASQPSVEFDLWGSGFSAGVWASYCASSGFVDATEYDYYLAYSKTFMDGDMYQIDSTFIYTYYDFVKVNSSNDNIEYGAQFVFPNLLGDTGIIPSYYVGLLNPAQSNSGLANAVTGKGIAGWAHAFGLDYALMVPGTVSEDEQAINLSAVVVYNDGYAGADSDWSHATFGVDVPLGIGEFVITPAVYWQQSFERSVNTQNELYSSISATLSF